MASPAAASRQPFEPTPYNGKTFWQNLLPVMTCGAGLFSDGYINNVIGSVGTIFSRQYGDLYDNSNASHFVSSIAFAGTVIGQLAFGYLSDKWSRTHSLMLSTLILVVFTALSAGSYWYGDTIGMFNILVAWRFLVGIGIGGEYPAGSVSAAESTSELRSGTRDAWFILFTNSMIDWGFVIGAFVPFAAAAFAGENYSVIWRASLAVGVLFPMALFVLRVFLKEPEEYRKNSMKHAKVPYWLVLRFYGWRLFIVSAVWFIYDFSAYSFGIYSSAILANIFDKSTASLSVVFGWNTVLNLFNIPGTMLGAPVADRLGPRDTLILGVTLQGFFGFIMAGAYRSLAKPNLVGAFAVLYGIFLSLGEFGPGNNIGLMAAKTCATGIRGQYYGIAAAIGKLGAFVGTLVFPYLTKAAGADEVLAAQIPFYVSSTLCLFSAVIVWLNLPIIGQDTIQLEDYLFRKFLEENKYDTNQLGLKKPQDVASVTAVSEHSEHAENQEQHEVKETV
ncbi:major facilitator superfamily domain-containing protein [Cladorrhinum samala]|uniref:Major facilitator superfamily domain-containing protein n=1 Tax=Cladorrhinum samala TaxID=585594 RepID=A0AAV9HUI8_9PEZI|nr:major facilitator superfamily domain-containing protein [Cladorrhinum samala]